MNEKNQNKELADQLDDMLGDFLNEKPKESEQEETPSEETPAESPSEEEGPEAETPSEESTSEEETQEETPAEEETSEETPTEETPAEEPAEEDKDELIKRLRTQVEELSGRPAAGQPAEEQPAEEQPTEEQPAETGEKNYFDQLDFEEVIESPEKLNKVLNAVASAARNEAVQQAVQQTLQSVPGLVVNYVKRHSEIKTLVDDFYDANPDLKGFKKTVGAVANELHSKNPDWDMQKVFEESAKEARKTLGLKAAAAQKRKPALASSKGRGRQTEKKPTLKGMEKEIEDLIS